MRCITFSPEFAKSAACFITAAVVAGCAGARSSSSTLSSARPRPAAVPAPASQPISTIVPITAVAHGHHVGTVIANNTVTFGDYFIQKPTHMNGLHAGADGLLCQSAKMPKMLQIVILKRTDTKAPVPKLVTERSPADPPHSLPVPSGTKISQVKIGVFHFYRGDYTDQAHQLKIITLSGADEDNDIFIRAAADNDAEFADLQDCIATFKYAAPEAATQSHPAP